MHDDERGAETELGDHHFHDAREFPRQPEYPGRVSHPRQAAMITIRIKDLRLRTYIGFNDDERQKRQDVVINVRFSYMADHAAETDDVKYAVNYRTITKDLIRLVEEGRFMLLERLAAEVLELVMSHPKIGFAEVEVDKPHALRFSDSVSATLSASR